MLILSLIQIWLCARTGGHDGCDDAHATMMRVIEMMIMMMGVMLMMTMVVVILLMMMVVVVLMVVKKLMMVEVVPMQKVRDDAAA